MKPIFSALATLALATAPAQAGPILFLVAEHPEAVAHGDSYVLPLSRPEDIAHARRLIAEGSEAGSPIAVAAIAPGADSVNRDHLAPGAPPWSWHVTEFLGFADVTAELLDGWPGLVESDVGEWIRNTDGRIGFWNYTVIRELGGPPIPVPEPGTLVPAGLGGLGLVGVIRRRRRA